MAFFAYIVKCSDGTFYSGYTVDLKKRVHEHNHSKLGASYTKGRRPVKLVYSEEHKTKSSAMKREHALKKLTRNEKENLARL